MIKKTYSNQSRLWRHERVRKKVSGTPGRPRLAVFRSANQIYAQVIDDTLGTTLVAASSREAELKDMAKRAPARPARTTPPATKPADEAAEAVAERQAPDADAKAETKADAKADAKGGKGKGGKGDAKGAAKAEARGGAKAEAKAAKPKSEEPDDGTPTGLRGIEENRRVAQARLVGLLLAERAKARGIERVVFDRGGYIYHGRVAALATGAREGGLDF
jgi:ribosomal protein L18